MRKSSVVFKCTQIHPRCSPRAWQGMSTTFSISAVMCFSGSLMNCGGSDGKEKTRWRTDQIKSKTCKPAAVTDRPCSRWHRRIKTSHWKHLKCIGAKLRTEQPNITWLSGSLITEISNWSSATVSNWPSNSRGEERLRALYRGKGSAHLWITSQPWKHQSVSVGWNESDSSDAIKQFLEANH